MQRPYIGITGFMSRYEVDHILGSADPYHGHKVMVGVLASQKTVRGEKNKWPNRYPEMKDLPYIFSDHHQALNLIHFNTKTPDTLAEQLMEVVRLAAPAEIYKVSKLHGFQLNLAWPDPNEIRRFMTAFEAITGMVYNLKIVLQIGGHAFTMVDNDQKKLADKVASYKELVQYVLLDPSGGYGKPFDTAAADAYLAELSSRDLDMGLGVAGGLSAETLDLVTPLAIKYPNLSIDAEGRLRDKDDNLDLKNALRYVLEAQRLFKNATKLA